MYYTTSFEKFLNRMLTTLYWITMIIRRYLPSMTATEATKLQLTPPKNYQIISDVDKTIVWATLNKV